MLTAFFALAAGLVAAWLVVNRAPLPPGLSQDEYDGAAGKFRELYRREPDRADVLSLAGEMAVGDSRLATAAACFAAIPSADRKYGLSARLQEGQVLLRLNRARDAERSLREFLSLAARSPSVRREHIVAARKLLCFLLSIELRMENRKVILADLHADQEAGVFDSKQFYFPHLLLWHSSTGRRRLPEFLENDPRNRQLREAEGRYLTAEGRLEEARTWLEELHGEDPRDLGSAAALLELLFESNDWQRFAAVMASLPDYESREPWLLTRMRAEFALHSGKWDESAGLWQRVLEDDPANPWAHAALARAYSRLDRTAEREEEQLRSLVLSRIRVGLVNVTEDDYSAARELASQCDEIGFSDAAETFRHHAERIQRAREGNSPR